MKRFGKAEVKAITQIIESGKLSSYDIDRFLGGTYVQKFEKDFARFHGCKYGIAVNSGTSALFVASLAAEMKGHKVAVPALGFTATTSQVIAAGGIPVFSDVEMLSHCMKYDFKTKFAIPVHLFGSASCIIPELKDDKIFVIEDCSQAMGASYKNKMVGSMGDCGVFSFQESKHITTLGEGGMITTNNEEFAKKCQAIRNHGEYYKNTNYLGFNLRMTDPAAAFGLVQLERLPQILKSFRKNANYIIEHLPYRIEPPFISPHVNHSFSLIGCTTKLEGNWNKFTKLQYEIPYYKKYYTKKAINAENFKKYGIIFDFHRWHTIDEIKHILEKIL